MNDNKFYKYATITALITAIVTSYNYYKINTPSQPSCNIDVEYISSTIQDWIKERVPNSFLKANELEVVNMVGFAEYKTIPQWNKMPLYEDFKHSVVCNATALVAFSPISTDKEKASDKEKNENVNNKNIEEISIRYQLTEGSGIRMSGIDVENMNRQIQKAINKYTKK